MAVVVAVEVWAGVESVVAGVDVAFARLVDVVGQDCLTVYETDLSVGSICTVFQHVFSNYPCV